MVRHLGNAILTLFLFGMAVGAAVAAEDRPRELDSALQTVKREMLTLGERMRALKGNHRPEPESVSIYLAAEPDLVFRPEKVALRLDGETISELTLHDAQRRALKLGGAAPLYRGRLFQGRHRLEALFFGKGEGNEPVEYRETWKLEQSPGKRIKVELRLDNARFRRSPVVDMRVID